MVEIIMNVEKAFLISSICCYCRISLLRLTVILEMPRPDRAGMQQSRGTTLLLRRPIESTTPGKFIPKFCTNLGVGNEMQAAALTIAKEAVELLEEATLASRQRYLYGRANE